MSTNTTNKVSEILHLRDGTSIKLPPKTKLIGGLSFKRIISNEDVHPYLEVEWARKDIQTKDFKTGEVISERLNVEYPANWADNAIKITADKYLFGKDPNEPTYEGSLKDPFNRIANTYTCWGWAEGYFASLEDAEIFNEEIKALLVKQFWAPNSPVWFNLGHYEQWRWGRPDVRKLFEGKGNKAFHSKGQENDQESFELSNIYEYPQASACFLTEVKDSMEGILDHFSEEGRIFASGSGVGLNVSTLRSSHEPISGKGVSSGPMSFNRGWDRSAGAIKSGGKTRRAARMIIMDSDHPDVLDFVNIKRDQEDIAKIILQEHNTHVQLRNFALTKAETGTPDEKMAARLILELPLSTEKEYDGHMDGLLYGETLSDQNANHTIALKGDFWQAFYSNGDTHTRWVTKQDHIQSTIRAADLLTAMAQACHECGEPGQHNSDWINLWNPVKSHGIINTSNPCSEYLHLNNTSCNLSSFNLFRFILPSENGNYEFDAEKLTHCARLAMVCGDLNIERGGFPTPEIAIGTYRYRTTGIGYCNVGGTLMAMGIPYDSDEGRYIAAGAIDMLTSACWVASAEMGRELGAYNAFKDTKKDLKQVINLHRCCHEMTLKCKELHNKEDREEAIETIWEANKRKLPEAQGLNGHSALVAVTKSYVEGKLEKRANFANNLFDKATELWKIACNPRNNFRNSFVSVMAPTGTISAPMGAYDEGTTSIEPDFTLVKWKQLSGGGNIRMFNTLSLKGLNALGYDEQEVQEVALEVAGITGLIVATSNSLTKSAEHLRWNPKSPGPVRIALNVLLKLHGEENALGLVEDLKQKAETFTAKTPEEHLVTEGMAHAEKVPFLSEEALRVLDTAATAIGGTRSIKPDGHMLMLGAISCFLSGSASKTVNLPRDCSIQDIIDCYVKCHDMGVKCIALYRDGSKGNSVFFNNNAQPPHLLLWEKMIEKAKETTDAIIEEASKPKQRKLPGRRMSQTLKFTVQGQMKGYVTVSTYPDGTCGEIFGRLATQGSFANGLFETLCKLISTMLQYGTPIDVVIGQFKNVAFEPSGFAKVGDHNEENRNHEIKGCKSVVDLLSKILADLFPASRAYKIRPLDLDFEVSTGNASATVVAEDEVKEEPTFNMNDAEACPECHSMAYVHDGKCKSCRDCGYKNGGCGA
jgi:ribonucleoside-diphosphate reductase alpha chain